MMDKVARKIIDMVSDNRLGFYDLDMLAWYLVHLSRRPTLDNLLIVSNQIQHHAAEVRSEIRGQQALF